MQLAHREILRPAVGALAAGMVVYLFVQHVIMGALGTGEAMSWAQRAGFWALVALLQSPISYASIALTLYVARQRQRVEIALALLLMVIVLAAPCTAIVFTIFGLFGALPMSVLSLPNVYGLCFFNLLWATALLYHVLWIRLNPAGAEAQESPGEPTLAAAQPVAPPVPAQPPQAVQVMAGQYASEPAAPAPAAAIGRELAVSEAVPTPGAGERFFDRLPDDLGRDIIYIAAAAHYVDVVTATGSAAILLRFSDAVAELGDLGLRVHRSYWVAYPHVKRAFRRDGRTLLLLTDDHEVRVGRNYLPEVRAAIPKAWIRARRRTSRGPAPSAVGSQTDSSA
jgi:hypothetical protein